MNTIILVKKYKKHYFYTEKKDNCYKSDENILHIQLMKNNFCCDYIPALRAVRFMCCVKQPLKGLPIVNKSLRDLHAAQELGMFSVIF